MPIQLLNGSPLIVGGKVAVSSDCCCTPPCIPDECAAPSVTNCYRCWDSSCDGGSCLELSTISFSIDGVGEVSSVPWFVPDTSFCRDGWNCQCDTLNATYIHSFTLAGGAKACRTDWLIRNSPTPPYAFDLCNSTSFSSCGFYRIRRQVGIRVAVANEQVSYTSGVKSSIVLPNYQTINSPGTNGLVCCNNYTIQPGHYVVVEIFVEGYTSPTSFEIVVFSDKKYFIYSFANGVKFDPSCSDNQYYPACTPYTGGDATLLASTRYRRYPGTPFGPKVYDGDCGKYDEICDLTGVTVTVDAPVVDPCTITPPPPPPP